MTDWAAPTAHHIDATVELPGSKSLTNRYLVLAALANSPTTIRSVLRSRDTDLMAAGIRTLGADLAGEDPLIVTPGPLRPGSVACGLAGTVMRFLPPLAALAVGVSMFTGDLAAGKRPMGGVLDGLRALGVQVDGDALPFAVNGTGRLQGGFLEIDASASSQFVSGLLLAAPRFTDGLELRHRGTALPSQPHIDMTLAELRRFGASAWQVDDVTWRVEPGGLRGQDVTVEPDLSNAAPFVLAALVAGGTIRIRNWPTATTQPGGLLPDIVDALGGSAVVDGSELVVTGDGHIRGVDLDLQACSELTPAVAAALAFADGPCRIRGVAHIRGHETDRLAALETELNAVGADTAQTPDGLTFRPARPTGGRWRTYADHRMATAGALIGLRTPDVVVEDIATVAKTMPTFVALWSTLTN